MINLLKEIFISAISYKRKELFLEQVNLEKRISNQVNKVISCKYPDKNYLEVLEENKELIDRVKRRLLNHYNEIINKNLEILNTLENIN